MWSLWYSLEKKDLLCILIMVGMNTGYSTVVRVGLQSVWTLTGSASTTHQHSTHHNHHHHPHNRHPHLHEHHHHHHDHFDHHCFFFCHQFSFLWHFPGHDALLVSKLNDEKHDTYVPWLHYVIGMVLPPWWLAKMMTMMTATALARK